MRDIKMFGEQTKSDIEYRFSRAQPARHASAAGQVPFREPPTVCRRVNLPGEREREREAISPAAPPSGIPTYFFYASE